MSTLPVDDPSLGSDVSTPSAVHSSIGVLSMLVQVPVVDHATPMPRRERARGDLGRPP
jgi:hypothetical protein